MNGGSQQGPFGEEGVSPSPAADFKRQPVLSKLRPAYLFSQQPTKEAQMTKTSVAKKIIQGVVSLSTYYVVDNIIKNNTDPEKARHKIETKIAAAAIGGVVAAKTERWAIGLVDTVTKTWTEASSKNKD